ncbi:MAG: hypothetical protein K0Q95_2155 [Bacteroidota bacterium]|jgi:hypothetical protein|nr:hypothetical protein [Bacteroidota bacterium]
MVDKCTIRFFASELVNKDLGEIYHHGKDWETGKPVPIMKLNNDFDNSFLAVAVNPNGKIKITGSLRKWYLGGRSIKDLSPKTFSLAINKLAIKLGVAPGKILNARIYGFEFGKNIRLDSSPALVLPCLLKRNRLKKNTYGNNIETVDFVGENYSLSLYDKVKEMNENGTINKVFAKKINILRYEVRIKKTSALYNKIGDVRTVYDIKKYWNRLVNVWYNEFKKIELLGAIIPITQEVNLWRAKDFRQYLMLIGIVNITPEFAISIIDNLGKCYPSSKTALRKEIKKITQQHSTLSNNTTAFLNALDNAYNCSLIPKL